MPIKDYSQDANLIINSIREKCLRLIQSEIQIAGKNRTRKLCKISEVNAPVSVEDAEYLKMNEDLTAKLLKLQGEIIKATAYINNESKGE